MTRLPTPPAPAAPAPWSPPRVPGTPHALALWNALASHLGQPIPLRGGGAAIVVLAPAPAFGALGHRLRFRAEPDLVFILVPVSFPFAAAFGADLAVEDLPSLPEALRDALGAGLAATFAAALPDCDLGPVETLGGGAWPSLLPAEAAETLRWFEVSLGGAAGPAVARVGASLETIHAVFAGSMPPRVVWPALRTALSREVAVTLARLHLAPSGLLRLVPGTVVLLDADVESGPRLRLGEDVFHFVAGERGLTCTARVRGPQRSPDQAGDILKESDMDQSPTHAAGEIGPGDALLDLCSVPVDIDLGHVTVALADLETWQVGSVVAVRPPEPGDGVEVTLRCNGRAIGAGELVRIDDRLAVRITRLAMGA